MKAIQITFDEELLHQLDSTEEVRQKGRSWVLRRVVAEYLHRRRRRDITERYGRAYGQGAALGDEFSSWEEQGEWPRS